MKGKMKRKEIWGQLLEHEVSHSLARGRKWREVGGPACLNEHPGQVELLPCLPRLSPDPQRAWLDVPAEGE